MNDPRNKKKQEKDKEVFTKEDFLNALRKTSVIVTKSSEKEKSKTSDDRRSGDYNEKHTH